MGAYATGSPLMPSGYIGGKITISAGQAGAPQQLLALIQAQLDANCAGAGQQVTITAGAATLYVGRESPIGGPLSATNFGRAIATGTSVTYTTSFPGAHAPIGDLQVFLAATGTFNVEVT